MKQNEMEFLRLKNTEFEIKKKYWFHLVGDWTLHKKGLVNLKTCQQKLYKLRDREKKYFFKNEKNLCDYEIMLVGLIYVHLDCQRDTGAETCI